MRAAFVRLVAAALVAPLARCDSSGHAPELTGSRGRLSALGGSFRSWCLLSYSLGED